MAKIKRTPLPEMSPEEAKAFTAFMYRLMALNIWHGGGHKFCPNDAVEQPFIPDL